MSAGYRETDQGAHGGDYHSLLEARLEAIVSIAADAIISIDASQTITMFNAGAEAIFGYSASEILGQPLSILLPEGVRRAHGEHIRQFGRSESEARRMGERSEITGRRKNGETFPAEASISKVLVGGEVVFTAILRDVTERHRTQQALQQAVAVRNEMLAIVSHDLRTPLSVVKMCASTMSKDPLPDSASIPDLARTVHESAEWMDTIIQDLLDVAHLESGKLKLRLEAADALDLLQHSLDMHLPLAAERGIRMELDVEPGLPTVLIDLARMSQVMANLLGNALKFTDRGGSILVSARLENDLLTVSVADTGRGVAAEDLPRLFDRYWQASRGDLKRGTGLGLAIAKGIVEAHGGRIWVRSTPGEGATFSFTTGAPGEEASADFQDARP